VADRLTSGQRLTPGQSLTSNDGRFTLVLQSDGNLVLYGPGGRYRWDTGTWGRPVEQAVMQSDGNFVLYAPGGTAVWDSKTNGNPGAFVVIQDDGNLVIYRADGSAPWASNTPIIRTVVPGFLPSTSGLHFPNTFPSEPHFTIPVGAVNMPIGDASNGLCGGMVFTTRDYFQAGSPPPETTAPPPSGPLYDHIVRRLYMSFELPYGPWHYIHLMNPDLPDHETDLSRIGLAPHGRAWEMINGAWPRIRADLDAGRLAPMALVTIKTHDPFQMGENHQILAYGYELDGRDLQIFVYDPNFPDDDWTVITLDIGDPQHTTPVSYTGTVGGDKTIWCFFYVGYTFWAPPAVSPPAGAQWRTWESLGGVLSSSPDVCSWAPGRLDVFLRGTDDALWHRWYDGGWSGWESLGGVITSDPAAVSWSQGRIDVFARGTDAALWHRWYDGGWSSWESLGGALIGGPDVSSWAPGRLDVFARGPDNLLQHRWYYGGWSGWESFDGEIASDPAAVSWGPWRIDVFARGADTVLRHKWYAGAWSDWEKLELMSLASGPDVSSWGSGRLDVFVHGWDNALWHKWYDGGWSSWETLGGRLTSDPTAVSWGRDRIDVFARSPDNALWHRWYG
jgi:Repeat of unknown function (DUF346)